MDCCSLRGLGYAIFKHGGIRVRVLEALGGLGFAFLNHGGIRVEVFKACLDEFRIFWPDHSNF